MSKQSWLSLFLFSSLFFFLLLSLIIVLLFLVSNHPEPPPADQTRYQKMEIDMKTSTTNYETTTLPRKLLKHEFIHQTSSNKHVIISRFGDIEFECEGSCYCTEERRQAGTLLTRGLYVIISAFSASFAAKLAGEVFKEACNEQYYEDCDEADIHSEVRKCIESEKFEEDDTNGGRIKIAGYSFGKMRIQEGTREVKYTSDLIIFPSKVESPWWRKNGHKLILADIPEIVSFKPSYLVVGKGRFGFLKVSQEVVNWARENGVRLIDMNSASAWKKFNELSSIYLDVVGAFHLTC